MHAGCGARPAFRAPRDRGPRTPDRSEVALAPLLRISQL